jgi:MFS family permease
MKKSVVACYLTILTLFTMGLGFSAGVYSNFLRSAGLDELQICLVNVFFFVTIFLFEIPTGIFADVYGRKKSFLVSCFLLSVSMFVYSSSKTFWGFATAETIGAIGATFYSGAFQAWFVDSLKHHGYGGKLNKIFAWESTVRSLACIVSAIIGGYLADISYSLPWFIAGMLYIVTLIVASIIVKEEYFKPRKFSLKETFKRIKITTLGSISFTKKSKVFRFVVIIGTIQMFCLMTSNMQWQKIFIDKINLNVYMGIIMAFVQIMIIIGSQISRKNILNLSRNEKMGIAISQLVIGIGIILTVMFKSFPITITFFMLHELGRGMFGPIKSGYLQENIPSRKRATIGSFESMYTHIGGALGLVTFGWIAKDFGIPTAWIVSGSILTITSMVVFVKNKK